jgi:cytochrome d ubiquinol oxidase subunit I
MIVLSLTMYLVLYAALIAAYVSVLFHLARKAGKEAAPEEPILGPSTPALSKEGANA